MEDKTGFSENFLQNIFFLLWSVYSTHVLISFGNIRILWTQRIHFIVYTSKWLTGFGLYILILVLFIYRKNVMIGSDTNRQK